MNPVEMSEFKLALLQDQAERADARIVELNQELLLHRGGSQHLGQVATLIEGHRGRLVTHAKDRADKGTPLEGQADVEHKACQGGILDALAYLRAQIRAAELSATRTDAALQEMARHRTDLSAQGKQQAGKVDALMEEVASGTPPEMAGRPEPADSVRQKLDAARADALPKEPPGQGPGRGRRKAPVASAGA